LIRQIRKKELKRENELSRIKGLTKVVDYLKGTKKIFLLKWKYVQIKNEKCRNYD